MVLAIVSEDTFDRIIAAFLELPVKKRLKFKYALCDPTGARRSVHWDGEVYFYMNGGVRHHVACISGKFAAHRPDIAPFDGEAFQDGVEAAATGNHYRNHHVRVPTQPGQPVRG